MKSVLFVCTGNICRSPIAEGLFRRLLGNRKDIEVVSAGVHAVRGQPPSLYAVEVCAEAGVDISNLRSQPLTAALVDRATHIFAMTGAHLETIQTLFPQGAEKSFLLREFEEPGTTVWRDLPDPIGLGREVYEHCARIIKNALPSVLAFVEQGELVRPGATRARELSSYSMDHLPHRIETGLTGSKPPPRYGEALRRVDPEIFDAIAAEEKRQRENIELIASENFTSRAVMEAQGSVLTNKYAEGYPRKRWYGGCENVDTAEQLAIDRAKRLFGCEHVNVQPHSGAQANMAVYFAVLKPGDKILAMNLAHGGHLTHGHPANFSGKFYAVSQYGVSEKTEQIDYDALQKQAEEVRPGNDYRRRVCVSAHHRFSTTASNRGFGWRAFVYRHGAHRRSRSRWSASQSDPTRAICHHHDAQEFARAAWRHRYVRREIRQADRRDCFPRRTGRPAHACDRSESRLLS